jgi:radical SAM protein with 4Fe4S-binding SPASM domain
VSEFQYKDSRGVSNLVSETADPHEILAGLIGPAYAEYRQRWEAARTFQEQPAFPLHVDYEMMFRCNLTCPICLMSLPPDGRKAYGSAADELKPETVKRLIDEGAASGQRAMGFGGLWEPLLSPAIPKLVEYGRVRGLADALFNTNGYFLSRDIAWALIDSGLTKLMVSLDAATEPTYNKMRPGSNFKIVCQNIENFINLRAQLNTTLPLLRLSFCRTALNEDELEPFINRWQGAVDFFSIQTYGQYKSDNTPAFPKSHISPPPAGRCAQPNKRLLVRHNGDVLPCCDASATPLVIGNIYKNDLAEIWAGKQIAEVRERLENGDLPPACAACQKKFG